MRKVFVTLLIVAILLTSCSSRNTAPTPTQTSQSEQPSNLASEPITTETAPKTDLDAPPQLSIEEFKAESGYIAKECAIIAMAMSKAMDDLSIGKISVNQFLLIATDAEEKLEPLLERARKLSENSLDIFYPGEQTHLATYLELAVSEFKMGVAAIKEGVAEIDAKKIEQGNMIIKQATEDINKFNEGLAQL